jgi:hypothetical protein
MLWVLSLIVSFSPQQIDKQQLINQAIVDYGHDVTKVAEIIDYVMTLQPDLDPCDCDGVYRIAWEYERCDGHTGNWMSCQNRNSILQKYWLGQDPCCTFITCYSSLWYQVYEDSGFNPVWVTFTGQCRS